jgi:hypothetical protein
MYLSAKSKFCNLGLFITAVISCSAWSAERGEESWFKGKIISGSPLRSESQENRWMLLENSAQEGNLAKVQELGREFLASLGSLDFVPNPAGHNIPLLAGPIEKNAPNKMEILKFLIEEGKASPNMQGESGTPLMFALYKNDLEAFKYLLDKGATVYSKGYWFTQDMVISSISLGKVEFVAELIKRGTIKSQSYIVQDKAMTGCYLANTTTDRRTVCAKSEIAKGKVNLMEVVADARVFAVSDREMNINSTGKRSVFLDNLDRIEELLQNLKN